jgi:hypothetical protein
MVARAFPISVERGGGVGNFPCKLKFKSIKAILADRHILLRTE